MKQPRPWIVAAVLLAAGAARAQPPEPQPQPPPPPKVPDSLDRGAITAGIAAVKDNVDACNTTNFVGRIVANIKVSPYGDVSGVTLDGGEPTLVACMQKVLRQARFPVTQRGSGFRFPFAMGTPPGVGSDPIATDVQPSGEAAGGGAAPADPYAAQGPQLPAPPKVPRPPINMPEVLTTPTGWLLPAAVLYSKFSIDTGGGVTSDSRVGLGDVAEFGVATTDSIRDKVVSQDRSTRIQPYVTASFRLGVSENRLFDEQPGVTLGFRKSFDRNHDGYTTRIAELTLVVSKHFGPNFALHAGGAFWDASLLGDLDGDPTTEDREVTMHDFDDVRRQLRPFGGIEVRPLERSLILVDLGWAPEFCYRCTHANPELNADAGRIKLKPVLSWGVRYEVASWMRLESGVRVPDIGEANLLDAQIFGQVTLTSWALRRAVESLK